MKKNFFKDDDQQFFPEINETKPSSGMKDEDKTFGGS